MKKITTSIMLIISTLSTFAQNSLLISPTGTETLKFNNSISEKITLFDNGVNSKHGIGLTTTAGVQSRFNLYVPTSSDDFVFGVGSLASFTERLRIKGNGQLVIPQKNVGGYGGLLIQGNVPGSNYPNIAFSVKNAANNDVVAAMIQGDLTNAATGNESIDLNFLTSTTGLGGLSSKMLIKANGNVGIGTNNPTQKLEINGNQILNGYLSIKSPTHSVGIGITDNYLYLNGANATSGNGVWINNTGSIFGGIKFKNNYSIAIHDNEGTAGQMLSSNGAGNSVSWKSLGAIMQNLFIQAPAFTPPNNLENSIPSSSITFTAPTAGKLIIFPTIKTKYICLNPLDHCHISADFFVKVDGSYTNIPASDSRETFQNVFAYLAYHNINSFGPYVVDVSAGSHTITFHYKLNTITPAPLIDLKALAQFIPN